MKVEIWQFQNLSEGTVYLEKIKLKPSTSYTLPKSGKASFIVQLMIFSVPHCFVYRVYYNVNKECTKTPQRHIIEIKPLKKNDSATNILFIFYLKSYRFQITYGKHKHNTVPDTSTERQNTCPQSLTLTSSYAVYSHLVHHVDSHGQ